jgi:hypothetical protein
LRGDHFSAPRENKEKRENIGKTCSLDQRKGVGHSGLVSQRFLGGFPAASPTTFHRNGSTSTTVASATVEHIEKISKHLILGALGIAAPVFSSGNSFQSICCSVFHLKSAHLRQEAQNGLDNQRRQDAALPLCACPCSNMGSPSDAI